MFTVAHWLWNNVVAGLAVVAIGAYTVVPRINARIADVTAAFNDRREFRRRITTILALCARLAPGLTSSDPVVNENFAREEARWLRLLDEHTVWLWDNVEWYSLGWPGWGLRQFPSVRDLSLNFSAGARSIMLANAPDEAKVQKLQALATHAQVVFCARRTPKQVVRLPEEARALRDALVEIGAWPTSASVPSAGPVPSGPGEAQAAAE